MTDQGWATVLGLGAIGAALLQAGVLVWQIVYLRGTVGQMKDSERRQLRAYVAAEDATLAWTAQGPVFTLSISNTGLTPARYFEVGVVAEIIPRGPSPERPIPNGLTCLRWNALGGGRTRTAQVSPEDCGIRSGDLKADLSQYLSARGRILYADIFDDVWESEFAFFIYGHPSATQIEGRDKMSQPHGRLKVYQKAGL
jgi:hypothetical protein